MTRAHPSFFAAVLSVFAVLAVLGAPASLHAGTPQDASAARQKGMEARAAKDWTAAADHFRRALTQTPEDPELLFLLGTSLGFGGALEEAERTLERAVSLSPDDADIRLSLARVKSWRKDFDGALRETDRVLGAAADNTEAITLAARLHYFKQEWREAQALYQRALDKNGADAEALDGMGDVKMALGEPAAAADFYARAQAAQPSPEREAKLAQAREGPARWHLFLNGSRSTFERSANNPWREGNLELGYDWSAAWRTSLRYEHHRRFENIDNFLGGRLDWKPLDGLALYAGGGGIVGQTDFLAKHTITAGGSWRLWREWGFLGPTIVLLDGKHAVYTNTMVDTLNPALQYYLTDRLWLTVQSINSFGEDTKPARGAMGRADWTILDGLTVYGGYASAPDTDQGVTATTKSHIGGAVVDVSPALSLRFDYAREDRERSYLRHVVNLGLSVHY